MGQERGGSCLGAGCAGNTLASQYIEEDEDDGYSTKGKQGEEGPYEDSLHRRCPRCPCDGADAGDDPEHRPRPEQGDLDAVLQLGGGAVCHHAPQEHQGAERDPFQSGSVGFPVEADWVFYRSCFHSISYREDGGST